VQEFGKNKEVDAYLAFSELLNEINDKSKELIFIPVNNPDLTNYLFANYSIKQNNGYDCGVAVISFIKRIQERYQGSMDTIKLGGFDFEQDRKHLRDEYLSP
jgi:hypothetical protein